MTGDDVATEVVVQSGSATGRGRHTVLRLGWRRSDPLAVSVAITAQPDHPSLPRGRWVVLRDFLRYGMEEPTGDGDVRIIPNGDQVEFHLTRDGRPCQAGMPCGTVRAFLDATEQLVPSGEESSEEVIDALIERLLQA